MTRHFGFIPLFCGSRSHSLASPEFTNMVYRAIFHAPLLSVVTVRIGVKSQTEAELLSKRSAPSISEILESGLL